MDEGSNRVSREQTKMSVEEQFTRLRELKEKLEHGEITEDQHSLALKKLSQSKEPGIQF